MKKFKVQWAERHEITVEAETAKEARDKVEDMKMSDLKVNPAYEVGISDIVVMPEKVA